MTTAATLMIAGRVIFGAFFLVAGIRNTLHFSQRMAAPTNYGWLLPAPLVAIGIAMQFAGGLSLVLGLWVVAGSLLLILFLVVATALYHNLFVFKGTARDPHLYLTLVNITLAGGLLLIVADAL